MPGRVWGFGRRSGLDHPSQGFIDFHHWVWVKLGTTTTKVAVVLLLP